MSLLVASVVALPTPASAWVAFAKITTSTGVIDGGVTAKGFEKQIEVLGVGNRLDLPVTTSSGGGTPVGALQKGRFQIVKKFDQATPKLVTTMSAASSLTSVEVTIFKRLSTGVDVPGFKIVLTNALISQLDTTYDPGADPSTLEKLEIFYGKLTWTDLITGATGSTP
jgi:type VI secretion system Hcp family effector